jgi:hypothetical protein
MKDKLDMEVQTLKAEKKMNEMALKGYQWSISQQLNNSMGRDMKDVLEGRKVVKLSFWKRVKNKFKLILWHLT